MPVWQASAARRIEHRERRARAFAEPHAEIEQRLQLELVEQRAVPGFGRHMRGLT